MAARRRFPAESGFKSCRCRTNQPPVHPVRPRRGASKLRSSPLEPISGHRATHVYGTKGMSDRRSYLMGAGCILMVALMSQGSGGAQDPTVATVASPALVTATAAPVADQGVASQSPRVIISVTAFRPPREG